jgi:amino acid efflux transporter
MTDLRKQLTLWGGTQFFLNLVIGAGVLTLPGMVYRQVGDLSLSAWIFAGIVVIPLLIVFAILGRHFPDAGGIAHYAERVVGPLGQLVVGFLLLGAVFLGLPSIALTGAFYLKASLGGPLHVYAALLIILSASPHMFRANRLSRVLTFIGSLTLVLLLLMVSIGFFSVAHDSNIARPVFAGVGNWSLLISPFMMIIFAFTGWEIGAHASEEFCNPRRDFPIAMALSYAIALSLYLLIAWLVASARLTSNYETPFIPLTQAVLGPVGGYAISALAVLLVVANLFSSIWGISRLVYSLASHGIAPRGLGVLKDRRPLHAVMAVTTVLLVAVALEGSGLLGLESMLALAGQNFFILYLIAAACLWKLSRIFWHRLLASSSIFVSGMLILQSSLVILVYPMALIGMACLTWVTLRTKAI